LQRQLRNFENVTLVARRRKHFRVCLAIFLVAQIPPKRGVLVHKNSLASYQQCRHSVAAVSLKRIEISLVFVTIMLHVLMHVVSNKLFWN